VSPVVRRCRPGARQRHRHPEGGRSGEPLRHGPGDDRKWVIHGVAHPGTDGHVSKLRGPGRRITTRGGHIMSMTQGSPPPAPAPILIGVIYDFPQADGGRLGRRSAVSRYGEVASTGRIDRPSRARRPPRPVVCPPARPTTSRRPTPSSSTPASWPWWEPSISDKRAHHRTPGRPPPGSPPSTTRRRTHPGRSSCSHYQVGSLQEEPVVLVRVSRPPGHLFSGRRL